MSNLYLDSHGRSHKRSRDEVIPAMKRINKRNIVIERTVLRSNIRVTPFDFIYQVFLDNGWLSLFDAVNIYIPI
jgi:predicted transcriptional regulator